jgi:hypothetical protein
VGLNGNYEPALIASTTAASSITLNGNIQYQVQHNGIDESGNAQTEYIMLATDDSTAAASSGAGKAILTTTNTILIGPGIETLKFDASANDPTFTILPIAYDAGRH